MPQNRSKLAPKVHQLISKLNPDRPLAAPQAEPKVAQSNSKFVQIVPLWRRRRTKKWIREAPSLPRMPSYGAAGGPKGSSTQLKVAQNTTKTFGRDKSLLAVCVRLVVR